MPLKTHQDEQPSLNLTPMIDIVFLLIIFFMVGTKFTELERSMVVRVPPVEKIGPSTSPPAAKVVNVHRDGRISLDRQDVTVDELVASLTKSKDEYPDLAVSIRGDGEGAYRHVANVISAVHHAGIANIDLPVRRKTIQR
jgi:biopolymer transport protein ExbD